MTKLISGRVKKTPSANVSAGRYEFIRLSETEPDLGVPAANGYILTANVDGTRRWIALNINESTNAQTANTAVFATLAGTANIALRANVATLADTANTALFATNSNTANTSLRANVATQADSANIALSANTALFATNSNTANTALIANVAIQADSANNAVFASSSAEADIALRANVATLADSANVATSANTALSANFATTAGTANTTLRSNVATLADSANTSLFASNSTTANTVLSISNFTTSNLAEGTNLYYTNARVYSNVIAALSTYSGNISVGNLIANTIITGPGSGGFITGANLISANNISATNWLNLYTANVIETSGNLYFTNARVFANVSPLLDRKANVADLTTANVAELNNLYYTNSRVYSNIVTALPTYTGNINAGNVIANTIITGTGAGGSFTGANLISAGNIFATTWLNLYTANVIESAGALYYTNARVLSNVSPLLALKANVADLTTANVAEVTNLYYTNSRVYSNITAALPTYSGNVSAAFVTATKYFGDGSSLTGVGATTFEGNTNGINEGTNNLYYTNARVESYVNPKLTTANVVESSNNLYYTNSRVYSNVITALPTYSGNIGAGNVTIGSGTGGSLIGANLISAVNIAATNWIGLYTANVIESQNALYYTNARVYANVIPLLDRKANVADLTTSNVIEGSNLYYTTARANAAITVLVDKSYVDNLGVNANTLGGISSAAFALDTDLTTANITELNNLYYTNSRVRSAITGGTGVAVDSSSGIISIGQNVSTTSNVTFGALNVTGPVNFYSNVTTHSSNNLSISDNMIYLNASSDSSNPDLGISFNYNDGSYHHAGFFRDATDGTFKVFDNYDPEPDANIFINTDHASFRLANLSATTLFGNVQGTVSTLSNFTTSNLAEGTNKYFSNALARAALSAGDSTIIYDPATGTIRATANVTATIETTVNNLSTANVTEAVNNLYYTNARVYSNVLALLPTLAGDNITISANGRISANLSTTVFATSVIGLNTANVSESNSNLYYTNARVLSNVTAYLTANPVISTYGNANVGAYLTTYTGNISAGNVIANSFISTAPGTGTLTATGDFNIVSGGNIRLTGNVYANTFVSTATGAGSLTSTTDFNLIAAGNISLNVPNVLANGTIVANRITANLWSGIHTANVIESASNLYFTNARVQSNVVGFLPSLAGDNITIAANGRISATVSATVNVSSIVGLTTANVAESNNNLYYTNARVLSNVTAYLAANPITSSYGNANVGAYLTTYTGNINAGNIFANSIIAGQGLGGSITGANLISANNISASVITANTIIGGGSGGSVTGANLISTNNISSVNWIGLYTANVIESGNSIFYTNARVLSNITAYLAANPSISTYGNANVGAFLTTYTGNIAAGNLILTGGIVDSVGVLSISTTSNSNIELFAAGNGRILLDGQAWPHTDGVNGYVLQTNGTGNLFWSAPAASFGNANVGAFLTTYTGNVNAGNIIANAIVAGTGLGGSITGANLISANNISASVITANTIIGGGSGGSVTGANLISTNNISSVNWIGLYTANVIETSGNLYFTNARVVSALAAGSGISISGNGQISSTATITATSVTGLNTANVNEFGSNLYYTNARVLSNVTAYLAANPVISTYGNANVGAYLTTYTGNISAGNVIANSFVSTAAGTGTLTATGDFNIVSGGNIRLTGNVFANTFISTATGTGSITSTSDFNINAASNVNITAANINLNSNNIRTTGNVTASKFFGDGSSLTGISASSFSGNTNGITEGTNNLYYTNTRVYSNVIALLPTLAGNNITIEANGRISANVSSTVFATAIVGLTTANVTEVGSNLYFTNTRVVSALSAGEGITLSANGQISGGVHAITDSQTFAGGNANITLATSVSDAKRIIVTIDGLVQIPITDYTVSGTILTLIPTPSPNSTIEVKFFGNEAITTQTFNPFLLAGL